MHTHIVFCNQQYSLCFSYRIHVEERFDWTFFVAHRPGICYNVKWIFVFGVRIMKIRQMTDVDKRAAAKAFVEAWTGRGDEKQDAQNFWRQLLQSVYGVEQPETDVSFEFRVKNDQTGSTIFIDAYIHETAVLIEQKGMDIDLSKSYRQSDGSMPLASAASNQRFQPS